MKGKPNKISVRLSAVAALLLALLLPARAAAASTLADYRERLQTAAAMVQGLAEEGEELTRKGSGEILAEVRLMLPAAEQVERAGAPALEVDNSWLHDALDEYEKRAPGLKPEARSDALAALALRIEALGARVSELERGAAQARDKDAEKGRLNNILRRPEFNRETAEGGALRRLVEQFFEWVRSLMPDVKPLRPGTNARVSQGVQWLVFGLCAAVLAYVGWLLWRRRRPSTKLRLTREARVVLGERLEADKEAADLLEEAEALARAGDLRGAIRKSYIALLCELGDRRVIRLAQHKTNRDYLQAVRKGAPPQLYTEMLPLTFNFELHWYGLQQASERDWEDFRTRCRQALKLAAA